GRPVVRQGGAVGAGTRGVRARRWRGAAGSPAGARRMIATTFREPRAMGVGICCISTMIVLVLVLQPSLAVARMRVDSEGDGTHVGPPLTALRTKLADPAWLVAWLLKPSALRP